MEQMADPGKALLTSHTAKLVSGYFRLRDLGEMLAKVGELLADEPNRVADALRAVHLYITRDQLSPIVRSRSTPRSSGRDALPAESRGRSRPQSKSSEHAANCL